MLVTPQPAKAHLAMQRISNKLVAEKAGCSEGRASRMLNGFAEPTTALRAAVVELLGMPETVLFRPGTKAMAQ